MPQEKWSSSRNSRHAHPQGCRRRPIHGYAISQRIQQISKDFFQVPRAPSIPPSTVSRAGLARGAMERHLHGREAKFYTLTRKGRKQLETEVLNWSVL